MTRYGLCTITLYVEEEGIFLVYIGDLMTKGGGDDEVTNNYN